MSIKVSEMVLAHGPCHPAQRLMLLALASHADATGRCWPGITSLAEKCCVGIRAARRTLRGLEEGGWISTVIGGGRSTNRYQINLVLLACEPLVEEPLVPTPLGRGRPGTPVVDDRAPRVPTPSEPSSTVSQPSLLPDLDPIKPVPRKRATSPQPEGFEEWWTLHPRKVSKGTARVAYAAALRKPGVTPALLLAALRAQLPEMKQTDTKFVKHPATWLRAEAWEDPVRPARTMAYADRAALLYDS